MSTSGILRQIAALASAEADRLAGITPTAPVPTPPPVPPPTAPSLPAGTPLRVVDLGVSNTTTEIKIDSGWTVAARFVVPAGPGQGQCSVSSTNTGGEAASYDAWLSTAPGGPPISLVKQLNWTGGAFHFRYNQPSPAWAQELAPGTYYINLRNKSMVVGYFYGTFNAQ